jgi:hypothetical protein
LTTVDSTTEKPNRKKLFLWLYCIALLVFFIALLEIASHAILSFTDQGQSTTAGKRHLYHPYRSHQLNPDYVRKFDSGGVAIHSPDGFRSDTAFSKTKPENTIRIVMMGGSTLYGIGATSPYDPEPSLQNDETISYYLQSQLRSMLGDASDGLDIEVINAGVSAYKTFHHLVYFNEVLYEYDADLLVFLDGHNDFYYSEIYNNWQSYKLGTVRLVDHFNHRGLWFTAHTVVRFLASYSRFFFFLESYMHRNWQDTETPVFYQPRAEHEDSFPNSLETVLDTSVFKTYTQFQALGDLYDFEMMVFLQPQVVFENPDLLSAEDQNIQSITNQYDTNTRRSEIRNALGDKFRRENILYQDIGELASEKTASVQLYTDYCHLTPAGSELLARKMSQSIYDKIAAMRKLTK